MRIGYDSSRAGVMTHDYIEEEYLLEGAYEDLQRRAGRGPAVPGESLADRGA